MASSTGFTVYYDFEYDGESDGSFGYDVPFETFCAAARKYFDDACAPIDGTDTSVWNVLVELDALDKVFDEMEPWLKSECQEDAYAEYINAVIEEHELSRELNFDD